MANKNLLQLSVTSGLDSGLDHWLVGDSISIGSAQSDTVILADRSVLPAHIVLTKKKRSWSFEVGRAADAKINTKPVRSGEIKSGTVISFGDGTELTFRRKPIPDDLVEAYADETADEAIPAPVAFGILGLILAGIVLTVILTREPEMPPIVRPSTSALLPDFEEQFADCVYGLTPKTTKFEPLDIDPNRLFWRIGWELEQGQQDAAQGYATLLYTTLRDMIRRGDLLRSNGEGFLASARTNTTSDRQSIANAAANFEAAMNEYSRILAYLPNANANSSCEIIRLARFDVAAMSARLEEN